MPKVGQLNKHAKKQAILNFLKNTGSASRIEISKRLSIDKKTVSSIVDALLCEKLLTPYGFRDSKAGRRQELLKINGNNSNFIGLDLGATHIIGVLTDLNGLILDRIYFEIRPNVSVDLILNQLKSIAKNLSISEKRTAEVVSLGVCTPGFINPESGMSLAAENIPGWNKINLKQLFLPELSIPVYIEDCSRAYGLAERRIGKGKGNDIENFIVLDVGYGIGIAIFIDGELYPGCCFKSGEIGHTTAIDNGHQCSCGKKGCLETVASGGGIARLANEGMIEGKSDVLLELTHGNPQTVTAQDVALAASMKDPFSINLFREAGHYIGIALANAVNLLNPSKIIIGGGLIGAGKQFIDSIENSLRKNTMIGIIDDFEFSVSDLGVEGSALGCAFLAMEHIYNNTAAI